MKGVANQQGLLENDETYCFGSEKNALPVVLVGTKSLEQLRFRKKRKTNIAGANLLTSREIREVKIQRMLSFGRIDNNTYTVDLEKVVLLVPPKNSRFQLYLSKQ